MVSSVPVYIHRGWRGNHFCCPGEGAEYRENNVKLSHPSPTIAAAVKL